MTSRWINKAAAYAEGQGVDDICIKPMARRKLVFHPQVFADTMRRHTSLMSQAISLARSGKRTEEQRQDFANRLVATFNVAQSAWDAYRKHLIEHGILPSPK